MITLETTGLTLALWTPILNTDSISNAKEQCNKYIGEQDLIDIQ